jgi:hypothetical protein
MWDWGPSYDKHNYSFIFLLFLKHLYFPDSLMSFLCRVNAELTAAVLKHVRVFKMMTPAPKESQLPRDALTAGTLPCREQGSPGGRYLN